MKHPHNTGEIKAVIFDMDGLLFDTEALYQKAWLAAGERMGIPITAEVAFETVGHANSDSEKIFQAHYGPAFTMEGAKPHVYAWLTEYIEEHGLPMKAGASEAVRCFHKKGFPLGLGSSNQYDVIKTFLELENLLPYFSVIVAADMVEHVKPAPDIFLRAARELGVSPSQCLVFEDSPVGVEAADAAGCVVAMVPDLIEPCAVTRKRCRHVLESLEEAVDLL